MRSKKLQTTKTENKKQKKRYQHKTNKIKSDTKQNFQQQKKKKLTTQNPRRPIIVLAVTECEQLNQHRETDH